MKILYFSKWALVSAKPTYNTLNKIPSRAIKNTFFLEHVAPTYNLIFFRNNNNN